MGKPLHFDYTASKKFCESLGLIWLGEEWVRNADEEAWIEGFTQSQVDAAMRHHLVQVKFLFTPRNYSFRQRLAIAFYFLTGWGSK